MEVKFTWDHDHRRLERDPKPEVCTREQNMAMSKRMVAIRGEDAVARDTAMYETARIAYQERDLYQPCRAIPGGTMPMFLAKPDATVYSNIREGLFLLSRCSNPREAEQAKEKSTNAQDAARFLDYVERVSVVESYNQSCCSVLLMSHAWLKRFNPEGDAVPIELLSDLLREWYGIKKPATEASDRIAQSKHHARDYRWLSSAWRSVWETA